MKQAAGRSDEFILECFATGRYQLIENGAIFDAKRGRDVPSRRNHNGYLCCMLRAAAGRWRSVRVHRVVAIVLRGSPAPGLEVDHIDGDKSNNRPENLELVDRAENASRAWTLGLLCRTIGGRGAEHPRAKLTEDQAREIRARYAAGASQYSLADQFGVSQSSVSLIVRGINWPHLATQQPQPESSKR